MSCIACTVIPADDSWTVRCSTVSRGPYLSSGMALRVATSEALALRQQGRRSKISVQSRAGETSIEYCICDAFKKVRP